MDKGSYFRFDDDGDKKTEQNILSTNMRELGTLNTYSPIYWIMDNLYSQSYIDVNITFSNDPVFSNRMFD